MEDNNNTGAVYLDLAKTFNTRKLKISISLNQQFYFSNLFSHIKKQSLKLGFYLSD